MLIRVLALFAILSIPAWPGVTLTLTPDVLTGMPGDELVFQGTFSVDNGDLDTFFTDLDFNFTPPAGSFLTPDLNIFFNETPGVLCGNDPGCQTQYNGDLFGIQIAPGTLAGNYFGTVTMLGGPDPSFSDPLTDPIPFEVTVNVASPEPGTLFMISPVLAVGLITLRRKLLR